MNQTFLVILVLVTFMLTSCEPVMKDNSEVKSLNSNWSMFSSEKVTEGGEVISKPQFKTTHSYSTDIPKTVLAALVENEVYNEVYFNKNLEAIPTEQFTKPWWYRKEFDIAKLETNDIFKLTFEGINYKANIWLNGKQIASKEKIEGAFGIFDIQVSEFVKAGTNILAVEVIPPVKGDLTIGFVDWNPSPPDQNLGLWRGVKLHKTKSIELDDVFVKPNVNLETLKEASLSISGTLKNRSEKEISVKLVGKIEDIRFEKVVTLKGKEERVIEFTPLEYSQLNISNPKLWWPNNLGEPYLYNLKLTAIIENEICDKENVRFGIREVSDYINSDGQRGYKVNGHPVVIKGAGWVDDLLLNDSDEKVRTQIEYAKHMNLNAIRLEGFWGKNKTLYEAADENGILLMIGWSCHWEWKGYCGREETDFMSIDTPKDMKLQTAAYADQVKWLRNHPSIFVWVFGSDKLPLPELEKMLVKMLGKNDPTRPSLASCKAKDFGGAYYVSEISGSPAVKMIGPYAYETPNYWYLADTTGGAWGYNTETGPGPQVPPLESLKRMIPEDKLWPMDNDSWKFHFGRNEFHTLDRYNEAFYARYGKPESVEEYAAKSQISNYEAMRPMFEAFQINKPKSTGVIQWMFNSAWPEMFWQLFDHYLMPNGAFYATKKACQPLHLAYNYKDGDIYIINDYLEAKENLRAELKIFNKTSEVAYEKSADFSIAANKSQKIIDIPELKNMSTLYFLSLELFDNSGEKVSDNFYWLSTKEDVLDWDNSEWFYTPFKSYADLTDLNTLPKAEIAYTVNRITTEDVELEVVNKSDKIAFFIDVKVVNKESGESFLPVFLSDNYFSLLPGESRTVSGSFKNYKSDKAKIEVKGWNTLVN